MALKSSFIPHIHVSRPHDKYIGCLLSRSPGRVCCPSAGLLHLPSLTGLLICSVSICVCLCVRVLSVCAERHCKEDAIHIETLHINRMLVAVVEI